MRRSRLQRSAASSLRLSGICSKGKSAILNITEDHLNRHHTMAEYIRVKELITSNQGPEDVCVLNYEDEILREFGKSICAKGCIFPVQENLNRVFSERRPDYSSYRERGDSVVRTEGTGSFLVRTILRM